MDKCQLSITPNDGLSPSAAHRLRSNTLVDLERTVVAYQVGVEGDVAFDEDF